MSKTSVKGLDGLSIKISRVLSLIAAANDSLPVPATKLVSMPKRGKMVPNNCWLAPNMLREATMWSPVFNSAITVDRIAAMPLAVAMQASAPSRAASRSCIMATVGLEKRA